MSECRRLTTPFMWLQRIGVGTQTALRHPASVPFDKLMLYDLTTSRGLCSYTIPYRIFQTFYTRAAVRLVVRYGDRDVGVPSSHHTAYAYITKGCGHANGTPASCLRTLLRAGALFVYNSLSDFPNYLHESSSPARSKVRRHGCRSAVA